MIRTAIVEDSEIQATTIADHFKRYADEMGRIVEVSIFPSGEAFLQCEERFDLVFLDIELPEKDGLAVAEELRAADGDVLIIFITNLAQYAVKGYGVRAFDFIVKPLDYYSFALKMRRAFECLDNLCRRKIWISTRQGKQMIDADKLKYVEVMQHTLAFHLTDGTVNGTGTLKSVQTALAGLPFFLCNRCYLVNLHFVTQINGNTVTVGGEVLQISIPKKKEFLAALNKFLAAGGSR